MRYILDQKRVSLLTWSYSDGGLVMAKLPGPARGRDRTQIAELLADEWYSQDKPPLATCLPSLFVPPSTYFY